MGVAQNAIGSQVIFDLSADIRGSRKIENGELFLVVQMLTVAGTTFTTDVRGIVRCLMKMP